MAEMEEAIIDIGKDVLVSLVILAIILGSLYAFSGRWPPMVVIESGSMMHSEESQIGVIDPGDIVLLQETDKEDITTYVEGRATGYEKYGQYGDVIIFEPDGDTRETPIIHRPVLYLEENNSAKGIFDIPTLQKLEYDSEWSTSEGETYLGLGGTVTIYDYGHSDNELEIDLSDLNNGGYITKGDGNDGYDQETTLSPPVEEEWILGRARGELPWFGIIKLSFIGSTEDIPRNSWISFGTSVGIILLLPIIADLGSKIYNEMSHKEDEKETDKGSSRGAEYKENDKITSSNVRRSERNRGDVRSERSKKSEE